MTANGMWREKVDLHNTGAVYERIERVIVECADDTDGSGVWLRAYLSPRPSPPTKAPGHLQASAVISEASSYLSEVYPAYRWIAALLRASMSVGVISDVSDPTRQCRLYPQ